MLHLQLYDLLHFRSSSVPNVSDKQEISSNNINGVANYHIIQQRTQTNHQPLSTTEIHSDQTQFKVSQSFL